MGERLSVKFTTRRPASRAVRLALLCAAIVLPIIGLSLYLFRFAASSVETLVESDNAAVATSAAELLTHDLNQTVDAASAFAKLPGMVSGTERHNVSAIRTLLQLGVESEPDVDRAAVYDLTGTLWSDYPMAPETLNQNFATRDYFVGVSKTWKPYISEAYRRSAAPQPWVVSVTVPIRPKGKPDAQPVGVLAFQVRLEKIAAWLRRLNVGHSGYAIVLDHNGAVAAHARVSLQDHPYLEYAQLPAVRAALSGQATSSEYVDPLMHQRMAARFIPVKIGGHYWVVIAQQPVSEAFAPIRRLEWQIGAAAATIALLLIWLCIAIDRGRRVDRESERFFNLSLDLLGIADFDGYFRRLNKAWERTLGYTTEELMREPFVHFVHPDDVATTSAVYEKQLLSGATIMRFENRYRCKDGSYRWLQWSAVPSVHEGTVFAAARDITELKDAHAMLSRQHQLLEESAHSERTAHSALKSAQTKLIQSERLAAVGQLVAGVAHEINNPLAFVTNNIAVLQRDIAQVRNLLQLYRSADRTLAAHDPGLHERLSAAAEACDLEYVFTSLIELPVRSREGLKRIQEIVRALLDTARVQSVGVLQEGIDLNAGIESTALIIQGLAKHQAVKLQLELGSLPRITCDPKRINQVILNLLTNAIDACAEGAATRPAGSEKIITVRTRSEGDGVAMSVIDNGTGIPQEILGKIFEPFFTTKPQGRGTGLGLSISHGIVVDHGGWIEVTSEPGIGSTFTLHLPSRPPTAVAPIKAEPEILEEMLMEQTAVPAS